MRASVKAANVAEWLADDSTWPRRRRPAVAAARSVLRTIAFAETDWPTNQGQESSVRWCYKTCNCAFVYHICISTLFVYMQLIRAPLAHCGCTQISIICRFPLEKRVTKWASVITIVNDGACFVDSIVSDECDYDGTGNNNTATNWTTAWSHQADRKTPSAWAYAIGRSFRKY